MEERRALDLDRLQNIFLRTKTYADKLHLLPPVLSPISAGVYYATDRAFELLCHYILQVKYQSFRRTLLHQKWLLTQGEEEGWYIFRAAHPCCAEPNPARKRKRDFENVLLVRE